MQSIAINHIFDQFKRHWITIKIPAWIFCTVRIVVVSRTSQVDRMIKKFIFRYIDHLCCAKTYMMTASSVYFSANGIQDSINRFVKFFCSWMEYWQRWKNYFSRNSARNICRYPYAFNFMIIKCRLHIIDRGTTNFTLATHCHKTVFCMCHFFDSCLICFSHFDSTMKSFS